MDRQKISINHYSILNYIQYMTLRDWEFIVKHKEDRIKYRGNWRQLVAKDMGDGIVEITKDMSDGQKLVDRCTCSTTLYEDRTCPVHGLFQEGVINEY